MDKLKKINELANELKKHNFAQSNDEAVKLAETFYKENTKNENQETSEEKTTITEEKQIDNLTEKKFELLLEIQEKKIMQELNHMRSTINFLKTRMELLNTEVEKLKGKAISSPISFQKKENEAETQANLQTKQEEKTENPRRGKYSSKDVDIQKMFYCGNKNAQD